MNATVKVEIERIPHGRVPFEDIPNALLKRKIMLLNDNIASLARQLETAQKAIQELQRR